MTRLVIAATLAAIGLAGGAGAANANDTPSSFGMGAFGHWGLNMFNKIHQHGPLYNYGPYYGYYPFAPYGPYDAYLRYTGEGMVPTTGYIGGSGNGGFGHGGHAAPAKCNDCEKPSRWSLFRKKSSCATCGGSGSLPAAVPVAPAPAAAPAR